MKVEPAHSHKPVFALPDEHLTSAFYAWEERGRGWQLWDHPVEIEPQYSPFVPAVTAPARLVDDGRTPSRLNELAQRAKAYLSRPRVGAEAQPAELRQSKQGTTAPALAGQTAKIVELQVTLPEKLKITSGLAEQFLLSLWRCPAPLSFEVVGRAQGVIVQVAAPVTDHTMVEEQLQAYFPEAFVSRADNFLARHWAHAGGREVVAVDFGLARETALPLGMAASFEPDPLTGLIGALARLRHDEIGLLQVIFQSARHPWAESIVRAITDEHGKSRFLDAPEMLPRAREKVSRPLFAAVVRVAARSKSHERAWRIVKGVGGALARFADPAGNELIALSNEGYDARAHAACVVSRLSHRSGMLLNSEELAALVHLPSASVRSEKLKRATKRTKPAPTIATGHELVMGENKHRDKTRTVTLSPEQRTKHMLVSGVTGSGKSTLLLNMIRQDLEHGHGLCVLDPHGDLIDQALGFVPESRVDDAILFDPADADYPVGFNILAAQTDLERSLLASDLVAVFKRLSTAWGDQMNSVLANAILAFLESTEGGTLADLRRFLVEREYRADFLRTVTDPEVRYYWEHEFPVLPGKPQAPILTRLDTFLRLRLIRNIVAQRENRLDFRRIMDERKILLVRLSQGAIGEENAHLLGALLVAKLHQAALSRQEVAEAERPYFFLYVDEFQNFVTPSMSSILSGARKYHMGLVLAHQELSQLWARDKEVASAAVSNPYTRVCFRLGDFDARRLAKGFSSFEADQLQNLSVGEAVVRVERNEYDFNLSTFPLPRVDDEIARRRREAIVRISRARYARSRAEVEAEMGAKRAALRAVQPTGARARAASKGAPASTTEEVTAPREAPGVADAPSPKAPLPVTAACPGPTELERVKLGRGGQQHRYLQDLVKRLAESRGYRVVVEQPVLGGTGSIDVAMERGDKKIACEISVTSTDEYELRNIGKCLAAGYDPVVLLSSEQKTINKVRKLAAARLDNESLARVMFLLPEEFVSYLEDADAEGAGGEGTVRGYKVKVNYKRVDSAEKNARKQAISQVVLGALRRMKKPEE
jgi:hypothetical protein